MPNLASYPPLLHYVYAMLTKYPLIASELSKNDREKIICKLKKNQNTTASGVALRKNPLIVSTDALIDRQTDILGD